MSYTDGRQAGEGKTELVVTTEMIEAGVAELREKMYGEQMAEIVHDVFISMAVASPLFNELGRLQNQRFMGGDAEGGNGSG